MTTGERFHILHLTDGNRGGSQRHIVELCRPPAAGARHFILRVADDVVALTDVEGSRLLVLERERIAGGWPVFFERARRELAIVCVHAHALDPLLELAASAAAPLRSLPYCVTLHDVRALDPDALSGGRTSAVRDREWNARC